MAALWAMVARAAPGRPRRDPGGSERLGAPRVESRRMKLPPSLAPAAGWGLLLLAAWLALGGAASRPDGVAWGLPSPLAALASSLVVGACARWRFERGRAALGLAPLLLLVLAAPHVPGARPLAGAPLLVLVVGAALAALGADGLAALRRWFVPIVFTVYAAASLNVQRQVGAEGDEPHYLMVAESLLRDGDLSLGQDYAEGRYRAFYRTQPTLAPHYLVRGREGEIYSQHALGLSLLVLPAYALGGYPGASLFLALLGVWLAVETRALLREWLGQADVAEFVAWAVALSPPLVHFAGLVFTEVPAALGLALGLRRLRDPSRLDARGAWLVGAALAFVPWLNVRYAPFPVLLLAWALWARPARGTVRALIVPSLVSALASACFHFQLYGFFDPRRVYGRRPGFAWARLPGGLEALLFDQEFGLLVVAPLFVLALPGAYFLLREARLRQAWALLAPIGVVLATAATWRMWWGGWTPPARFLVPVVPALALLVGWGLRRGVGAVASLLAGVGLCLGLAAVPQRQLVHRDRDGSAPLLRVVSGAEEWTRLLPAFVLPEADPARHRLATLWAAALAAAALLASRAGRDGTRTRAAHVAGASLGLLAAAGVASSLSSGRTEGRDAVRLIGRAAWGLSPPAWSSSADAAWSLDDVGWGPTYEAHRFPAGAPIGARLPLPPGRYRLTLDVQTWPGTRPPALLVTRDKAPPAATGTPVEATATGWSAAFDVPAGWPAVDLRLRGGGPGIVQGVHLQLQP